MGSKRLYDGQEQMQLPYKYQKQFATSEKLISYTDEKLTPIASIIPCNETDDKDNVPTAGHIVSKGLQTVDPFVFKSVPEVQTVVDKGVLDGLCSPWTINCLDYDHNWHKDFHTSFSPEYFESSFPRKASVLIEDPVLPFLDRYPRKQVPVGVNHQAELPEWVSPKSDGRGSLASKYNQVIVSDEEEILMGTCVIPMPGSSLAPSIFPAAIGRKDCDCVDTGSVRCVRQHVKEAREKLFNALGEDKFRELGFLDMGEEVAHKWSQEEEQVFHEIVFSNPASLGKDFWSCLSEEFPTKRMRDFVSYYFNVFMLRKRAGQNRSRFLDIDSDDDEWHPAYGRSYGNVVGEDNDSLLVDDGDSSDEDDDSDDDDDDDDDDNDGGEGTSGCADWEEKHSPNIESYHKDINFIPGNHDDSYAPFEFQSGNNDSTPQPGIAPVKVSGPKNEEYFSSDQTDLSHGCSDYSNFRQWDQEFAAGLDYLLPTENMIEEIFGPGSWDNKTNNDQPRKTI